jgi:hypothetical protein
MRLWYGCFDINNYGEDRGILTQVRQSAASMEGRIVAMSPHYWAPSRLRRWLIMHDEAWHGFHCNTVDPERAQPHAKVWVPEMHRECLAKADLITTIEVVGVNTRFRGQ